MYINTPNITTPSPDNNSVYVIDAEKLEVTSIIEDKKLPWGVVTYPKAMGSLDTAIK